MSAEPRLPGCKVVPASGFGLNEGIDPLWQVQRGAEVAKLRDGQGDAHHRVGACVQLFNHDAVVEGLDHDIFLSVGRGVVDQGDDRRVEFVLDGEHGVRLRPHPAGASGFEPMQPVDAGQAAKGPLAVVANVSDALHPAAPSMAWNRSCGGFPVGLYGRTRAHAVTDTGSKD